MGMSGFILKKSHLYEQENESLLKRNINAEKK